MADYSSTFTGDEDPLSEGGLWVKCQGDAGDKMYKLSGAAAADTDGATNVDYLYNNTFANDQYSEGVIGAITGISQFVAVTVRASGSGSTASNYGLWVKAGTWYLVKLVNNVEDGAWTETGDRTFSAGETIRIEVTGTTVTAKVNTTTLASKSDSVLTSGKAGIGGIGLVGANATLDSWAGGDLVSGGVAIWGVKA